MNAKKYFLSSIVLSFIFILAACGGERQEDRQASNETKTISGAEILEDAKTYAEQQCFFNLQERKLKEDPEVTDFELKMNNLKTERKKAKNFYLKKYEGMPTERVAFQRAVKAARQDSEYCNKSAKQKIK